VRKLKKKDKHQQKPLTSSHQAVEAAIDAAKSSTNQTWEKSAQKSRPIAPWDRIAKRPVKSI
jgi:hypothetical protein